MVTRAASVKTSSVGPRPHLIVAKSTEPGSPATATLSDKISSGLA